MSKPETIIKFADKIEASAQLADLTNAEFIYVLEALKHKRLGMILRGENK